MAIVKRGTYLANSCNYIMHSEQYDIKFLLGFLNSSLTNWIFKRTSTNSNVNCYGIEAIPLPTIVNLKQESIVSIVEKILSLTNDEKYLDNLEKQAKVKKYERQIDQMVYKLYDLTNKEIKIVEKNSK
jgi:hypothetical protein